MEERIWRQIHYDSVYTFYMKKKISGDKRQNVGGRSETTAECDALMSTLHFPSTHQVSEGKSERFKTRSEQTWRQVEDRSRQNKEEEGQRKLYWKSTERSKTRSGIGSEIHAEAATMGAHSWQVCRQCDEVNGDQISVTNTGPQGRKTPHGWESNWMICCHLLFISLPQEVLMRKGGDVLVSIKWKKPRVSFPISTKAWMSKSDTSFVHQFWHQKVTNQPFALF